MSRKSDGHDPQHELLHLIGDLINGTATPEQQARLNGLLTADAEARRMYRQYVHLHVALRAYGARPGGPLQIGLAAPTRSGSASTPRSRHRTGGKRVWWLAGLSAAALIAAAVAVTAYFDLIGVRGSDSPAPHAVASLTKALGARWGEDSNAPSVDAELQPGVLELAEGLVEITLRSGARVVLEAPAEIDLLGPGSAILSRGRAVVHVPPKARGFSLETPHARLIDLGTEFGVGVRGNGDTEVQVFQGSVITQWKGPGGEPVDQRLEAGRAIRIDTQSPTSPRRIAFEPERFVRTFPADRDCGDPSGPLYNRSRFDTVHVVPAPARVTVDGDLSDWDRSGAFYSACLPPYHESHYLEAAMMYDAEFLYLGAHVGDPLPMQSVMAPEQDPQQYPWRGGSVIVRLSTSPALGWPLAGQGPAEGEAQGRPEIGHRAQDISEYIAHLMMWYHRPTGKARLGVTYGMDCHGELFDPKGWQGAFRLDPNGRGYTLEYAIPWLLLKAQRRPPRAGDVLAANWTVHWSDQDGKLSRGYLTEITNLDMQPYRFLRASTWGKALYHQRGNLPPGTVVPRPFLGAAP
jgi:hypothetical protein